MLLSIIAIQVQAQIPTAFNYQGVARNGSGVPLANQNISLQISILDATASGAELFKETHAVTTNAYGLFSVMIGGGTISVGNIGTIDYMNAPKFLKIEMDPAGGTSYTVIGTPTQMIAVPYAMSAKALQATSDGGLGIRGNSASSLWLGFYENNVYRGYLGSYSGKNEDVDIGTGGGNTLGSMHLTIAGVPKLTVDSIGRVGIGTRYPQTNLAVTSNAGDVINIGNQNGWTAMGLANSGSGPYNLIGNGGTYMSFMYSATPTTSISATNSKMLMDGTTNTFRPTNDNVMSLGANGSRWTAVWAANGTVQTSDERYKTNIQPLSAGLDAVMSLKPISYAWKSESLRLGTGTNYGFRAQELNATLPDVVIHSQTPTDKETGKLTAEYSDTYGVKYAELTPVLVKAIQEQQLMIQQLQQRIQQLEAAQGK